jgi:hypothetical protein
MDGWPVATSQAAADVSTDHQRGGRATGVMPWDSWAGKAARDLLNADVQQLHDARPPGAASPSVTLYGADTAHTPAVLDGQRGSDASSPCDTDLGDLRGRCAMSRPRRVSALWR